MLKEGFLKVDIIYSSSSYDEFVGKILQTTTTSTFKPQMIVCVVPDFKKPNFIFCKDCPCPLSSIIVSEDCVFEIPSCPDFQIPMIVPLIKYGTICCYLIHVYHFTKRTTVNINCSYNLQRFWINLLTKLTKLQFHNINTNDTADISIAYDDNFLDISSPTSHEHINFNAESIVNVFGRSNVKKVIDYIVNNNITADIIHKCRGETLTKSTSRSRFFDIIDMQSNFSD